MKRLVSCAAALTIGILAACGGDVVVDSAPGDSGNGGGGSGSTGTSTPAGAGGNASCLAPPSLATLMPCGSSSGGAGSSCEFEFCDNQSNTWAASCTGSACQCTLNGNLLCTCALDTPGDICAGATNCCFGSH